MADEHVEAGTCKACDGELVQVTVGGEVERTYHPAMTYKDRCPAALRINCGCHSPFSEDGCYGFDVLEHQFRPNATRDDGESVNLRRGDFSHAPDHEESPANDPMGIAAAVGAEASDSPDLEAEVLAKLKPTTSTDLLTTRELALMDKLVEVTNEFSDICGIERTRGADMLEVVIHVHALQNMVMAQACARAYPQFRLMGQAHTMKGKRRTYDAEPR